MTQKNTWQGFMQTDNNCRAELVSASTPFVTITNKAKILNQVQNDNRRGFTLIELLVVVLIIAILVAVAVPQYRLAADKARLLRLLPLARSVKEAQEIFLLENGRYAKNWDELGTDVLPFPMEISGNLAYSYSRNLRISLYDGIQYMGVGPYSPDFLWIWNYDKGPDKGRLDCYAYNSYAMKLRKRICTYDESCKQWVYKP